MRNTLARPESLKSQKLIGLLFNSGISQFSYPFKLVFMEQSPENSVPVKFLISVSKKKIKTAVERNQIKRLFRESYRKQKHELFELMKERNRQMIIAFIFVSDAAIDYQQMEEKVKWALQSLVKYLKKNQPA